MEGGACSCKEEWGEATLPFYQIILQQLLGYPRVILHSTLKARERSVQIKVHSIILHAIAIHPEQADFHLHCTTGNLKQWYRYQTTRT